MTEREINSVAETWRLREIAKVESCVSWLEQKIANDQADLERLKTQLKSLQAIRYQEA